MSERKKFSKIWILLIAISLIVSIGAIWSWFLFVKKENDGNFINLDSWSSFWGGIIGAGATIIGAFLVMKIQIDEEKNKRKQEIINSNFSDLLNLHEKKLNNVHLILTKNNSISMIIDNEINRKIMLNSLNYIYDNKDIISTEVDKAISFVDDKKYYFKKNIPDLSKEQKNDLVINFKSSCQRLKTEFSNLYFKYFPAVANEQFEKLTKIIDYLQADLSKITIENSNLNKHINKISNLINSEIFMDKKEELSQAVTNSINSTNLDVLVYLDLYTKIINYIILNIDEDDQKDKLFLLNVNLSQEDCLLIFYYSCYAENGRKLWNMLTEIKDINYFMLDDNALFIKNSKEELKKIKPAS